MGSMSLKTVFWQFLTKAKQDKAFPSLCIGKNGPTAFYFDYDFWPENGLQSGTDLGPKITTKNGCFEAIFSHRHELGVFNPLGLTKNIKLPAVAGWESNLQMLNLVKLTF